MMLFTGCNFRKAVMKQIVSEQTKYFRNSQDVKSPWGLIQVTPNVYTYHWHQERNIIIDTSEGLVLTDPFHPQAARQLKKLLDKQFPNKPIHSLIYTHYHLDHVRGGQHLNPNQVIAHKKCASYWKEWNATDILQPTLTIEDDFELKLGEQIIKLLYLGRTHSDTNIAVYVPGEKVLFTGDLGFVKIFGPMGFPDHYGPGFIKGMERLAQLDFKHFIPSHFRFGKKQDFLDYLEFYKTTRRLCRKALEKYGRERLWETDTELMWKMIEEIYDPLKEKYGHWTGFNAQSVFTIMRGVTGEMLGF